jgi:elongation factor Ts
LLTAKNAKVNAFHMYIVGEGIAKKKDDFVAAVMAQAGNA